MKTLLLSLMLLLASPAVWAEEDTISQYMRKLEEATHALDASNEETPPPANTDPSSKQASATSKVQDMLFQALDLIGVDYKYGGAHPERGLDCSGLVKYVFEKSMNIALPHNALAMSKLGKEIGRSELKPGDLVFFNTLRRSFSHVGIYLGEGKFVHAPRTGEKVQIVNLNEKYWSEHYEASRRILPEASKDASSKTPSKNVN